MHYVFLDQKGQKLDKNLWPLIQIGVFQDFGIGVVIHQERKGEAVAFGQMEGGLVEIIQAGLYVQLLLNSKIQNGLKQVGVIHIQGIMNDREP